MEREKQRLIVHAQVRPDTAQAEAAQARRIVWRVMPRLGKGAKHTRGRAARTSGKAPGVRSIRTPGEKLLRNTAVVCALLMTVTLVSRIDQPWSRNVVQTVSGALTMRIDLDESLGRLNFVRKWMPDAALVFWNMGTADALARPVSGVLTHAFDAAQPWLLYQVNGEQPVYASADGTVTAVTQNELGEWTLLIDHVGGEQTVYAYLDKAIVQTGQTVDRGAQIGVTRNDPSAKMYFELRKDGAPTDPSERMR